MKLLGLNFYCIDWEHLYRNRTEQYRAVKKENLALKKNDAILTTAMNALNKENSKLCKSNQSNEELIKKLRKKNECLKALVESLKEDELAILCTSLKDENDSLRKRLEKVDAHLAVRREKNAQKAKRYRDNKKRQKEDPAIVDLDVLMYDARQLGYDLEIRMSKDEGASFDFISRDSGTTVKTFKYIENAVEYVETLKNEMNGKN